MTVYESLKKKEETLREASLRAESQDMKAMWLAKSKELAEKIGEMTIEEAEREVLPTAYSTAREAGRADTWGEP